MFLVHNANEHEESKSKAEEEKMPMRAIIEPIIQSVNQTQVQPFS